MSVSVSELLLWEDGESISGFGLETFIFCCLI